MIPIYPTALIESKGVKTKLSRRDFFGVRPLFAASSLFFGKSSFSSRIREIDLMKRKPILINVSRGGLVDTQALIRGLRSNSTERSRARCGWRPNRKVEQELLRFENVIVTPHVAWFSIEASQKLRRTAMTDILRVLTGQKPRYPVP